MFFKLSLLLFFVGVLVNGLEFVEKSVSLKPFSICCDIPELADSKLFEECSNRPERATCTDVQCAFNKIGLLIENKSLNKEAFREHLQKWSEQNQGWKDAVEKVIEECVDKENPGSLNITCEANDVLRCAGISLLKRCPTTAWKCGNYYEDTKVLVNGLEFVEKSVSLKPFSICCDIPDLADSKLFEECSHGPERATCTDVQCAFDKLGLLIDKETLNKDAFREHLQKWSEKNQAWKKAVHKVIEECVENENPRFLNVTCKANDVFRCTGISLLKRCPTSAWKCGNYYENNKEEV